MGKTAPGYIFGPRPVISHTDMHYLDYSHERDMSFQDGKSGLCPLLVLPRPSKDFFIDVTGQREFSEFFDGLWQQAANALGNSGGYSLRLQHARRGPEGLCFAAARH
jgi:hypothetical protein